MLRFLLLIYIALLTTFVTGQQVTGVVLDYQEQPLQDVYLLSTQTSTHAHTNDLGIFVFPSLISGDTIVTSHIGYASERIVYQGENDLKIYLIPEQFELDEVVVRARPGLTNISAAVDLQVRPVQSSQDILRYVPGLMIAQHAGGGKAEQIFLRGFDLDHGTDIAIAVDGMPVNMVSHAHGQGYADLHFLIPQTIEVINFGKGPYRADIGNFATAGHVDFQTRDVLEEDFLQIGAGSFNTIRLTGGLNLVESEQSNLYVASDLRLSDSYFESPQHFSRYNAMAKFTTMPDDARKLSLSASHFTSAWDASGQIPERAVRNGLITRFGAIDDTEGGATSRTNVILEYHKQHNRQTLLKHTAFLSRYDFDLFSNFTFFLEDPEHGDQIRQSESRWMFGVESMLEQSLTMGSANAILRAGIGFRRDLSHKNTLAHTLGRKTVLDLIQSGDIQETNLHGYVSSAFAVSQFVVTPAVRLDYFNFRYTDDLHVPYLSNSVTRAVASPKLQIAYNVSPQLQYYFKAGYGFHSNDTRVVIAQNGNQVLPRALGMDLGAVWKPSPRVMISSALWHLYLEQEFVYVGDAGVVEPGGRTRRLGLDVGARWQPADWLFVDGDLNCALARAIDAPESSNAIPLAPPLTATGGFTVRTSSGFHGSLRARYMADRPANESNTIVAEGFAIVDLTAGYSFGDLEIGITIENLTNATWNEAQFATESRLEFETAAVEELHFTPGAPLSLRGSLTYQF